MTAGSEEADNPEAPADEPSEPFPTGADPSWDVDEGADDEEWEDGDDEWDDDDFPELPADAEVRIDLDAIDHGGHRSGFVTLVGRPNVGTSSILNAICGQKVAITSDKPQTTRHQIRGVLTRPGAQLVFVDTPGIHRPRTRLGERLIATASAVLGDVDVACLVIDATAPVGPGDKVVASRLPPSSIVVLPSRVTSMSSRRLPVPVK